MRLFHVSEEGNIDIFNPRIPEREDLDKRVGLVWAIDEKHLANFLTPRNCPRVTYHMGEQGIIFPKRHKNPLKNILLMIYLRLC